MKLRSDPAKNREETTIAVNFCRSIVNDEGKKQGNALLCRILKRKKLYIYSGCMNVHRFFTKDESEKREGEERR